MIPLPAAGTFIADRYELVRPLGQGGMGSVWLARHLALDSPVAIKFVHLHGDHERLHARFAREAKLAASVRHRNVVSITDYGNLPNGTAFMVMDYLEGESFSSFIAQKPPAQELVHMTALALRGLVAVHDAGIVHRDLKPDNLFLVRDATGSYPKLIDFGISRSERERSPVTTIEGVIVGTPAYMSPEQARGLPDLDHRTDIYAVGVILYEALAGQLPYDAPHIPDQLMKIVTGGATPLRALRPDLDPALCAAVMKAMAVERSARFQTAREMLAALARLASDPAGELRSDRPPTNPDMRPVRSLELSLSTDNLFAVSAPPAGSAGRGAAEAETVGPAGAQALAGAQAHSSAPPAGVRTTRWGLWAAALALVCATVLALWLGSDGTGTQETDAAQAAELPQQREPPELTAPTQPSTELPPAAGTAGTGMQPQTTPQARSEQVEQVEQFEQVEQALPARPTAADRATQARDTRVEQQTPRPKQKKTRKSSARVMTELDY